MISELILIAHHAGKIIMSIYNNPSLKVKKKKDSSMLTEADTASNVYICSQLKMAYPLIPIISEESKKNYGYKIRKKWKYFFLVDPLDGTKDFIKHNSEFTINIALLERDKPLLGVIYAPALGITYYAERAKGAYKMTDRQSVRLSPSQKFDNKTRVLVSRSHSCQQTNDYLNELKSQNEELIIISAGSALKFGLIADGTADIYPRLAPTMEWDTAAGQILVQETGKKVIIFNKNEELRYNKINLVNPGFIVK